MIQHEDTQENRVSRKFYYVTSEGDLWTVMGYSTQVPDYWWVPELGLSMCENYQLFTNKHTALRMKITEAMNTRAKADRIIRKLQSEGETKSEILNDNETETELVFKLLPCPFCGSKNIRFGATGSWFGVWGFCSCEDCCICGPRKFARREINKEEVATAWNTRGGNIGVEAVVEAYRKEEVK